MIFTYKQTGTDTSEEFIIVANLVDGQRNYAKFDIMSRACGSMSCMSYGAESEFKACFNAICSALSNINGYEDENGTKHKGIEFADFERTQVYNWFNTLAANWN